MEARTTIRNITLADAVVPRSGILVDAALVAGFALLTAIFAQIAIRFPGTTVPITGQTLAVLLTGGALGSKRGALSMVVYMLLGMLFLPVFAPSQSLLQKETIHFILPWAGSEGLVWDLSSGGYIVGFILGAYLVGFLSERGWDRRARVSLAMVVGNVSIYAFGLPWLAWFIAFSTIPGIDLTYYDAIVGNNVLDKTLKGGLYPFIGGDALKLLVAGMVLPGAWELVRRFRGQGPHGG
ncbi:MAG: biotin transporter BioY [Chloroflexi bacterium]|nr:biotin transporter BioY [Chloroflexota bacterium]